MMSQTQSHQARSGLLFRALQADVAFCAATGLLLTVASGPIAAFIGVNAPAILTALGVVLLLYAAGLFQFITRNALSRPLVHTVIALNAVWVVASIVLLLTDWAPFTIGGQWAVAIVADMVATLGAIQFYALRRQ